jgi:DNA-binding NtrC family response regulator
MSGLLPASATSIESPQTECAAGEEKHFEREGGLIMNTFKIVVVDDEPRIANTLCQIIRGAGFQAFAAYEAEGAMMLCRHHSPAMLISDVNMPGISGLELAGQLSREMPACHIILFSGHVDTAPLLAAAREQGNHFQLVVKPVQPEDLLERIRTISEADMHKEQRTA